MISQQQLPAFLATFKMTWEGTPFRDYSRVPGIGGGVDCIHFEEAYLMALGVLDQPLKLPEYSTDWGVHNAHNLVREYLDINGLLGRFEILIGNDVALQAGDIVGFNTGSSVGHLGLVMPNGRILHCWRPKGVIEQSLEELAFYARKFRSKCELEEVYRLKF